MSPTAPLSWQRRLALARFHFQRRLLGERRRNLFARAVALTIGRREFAGPSVLAPAQQAAAARLLASDGYVPLGMVLAPEDLAAVHGALAGKRCHDPYAATGSNADFLPEHAPPDCVNAYYHTGDVVRINPLLRLANDPGILSVAQAFLGAAPTITDLSLWRSLLRGGQSKDNQLFHRDVDDFKFFKLLVYLTDVDETGGPHVYVRGSSSSPHCLAIQRYRDETVRETFGTDRTLTICGPAGTAFLVNTYGLHKGLAPVSRERLLFAAEYALLPVGVVDYQPVPVDWELPGPLDRRVNRLYLEQ